MTGRKITPKNDLFLNCRRTTKQLSKKELSNVVPASDTNRGVIWPKPEGPPPGPLDFQLLYIYENVSAKPLPEEADSSPEIIRCHVDTNWDQSRSNGHHKTDITKRTSQNGHHKTDITKRTSQNGHHKTNDSEKLHKSDNSEADLSPEIGSTIQPKDPLDCLLEIDVALFGGQSR